jgi:hypothetical protein
MPVGDANAGAGHREKPGIAPPRSPYLGTAGTDISWERCTTSQGRKASRGSAVKRCFGCNIAIIRWEGIHHHNL